MITQSNDFITDILENKAGLNIFFNPRIWACELDNTDNIRKKIKTGKLTFTKEKLWNYYRNNIEILEELHEDPSVGSDNKPCVTEALNLEQGER